MNFIHKILKLREIQPLLTIGVLLALCMVLIAIPSPEGLPEAGKRVIAVALLAIGLWCTEALPAGVTAIVLVVALVLTGSASGFPEALIGFADPVAFFCWESSQSV